MPAALRDEGFERSHLTRSLFHYLARGATEAHDDTVSGERVAEHLYSPSSNAV
ncbi:hypothetical protein ACN469_23905 [Corallococcus terminator]